MPNTPIQKDSLLTIFVNRFVKVACNDHRYYNGILKDFDNDYLHIKVAIPTKDGNPLHSQGTNDYMIPRKGISYIICSLNNNNNKIKDEPKN